MINTIADAIIDRLQGLGIFRVVEKTVTARAMQTPPAAAVFLAYDRAICDRPMVTRELGWDLLLLTPALGVDKGLASSGESIDMVRTAFTTWRPFTDGVHPATVPEIRLEGIEKTLLIYTVRLEMKVMPAQFKI